MSRISLFKALCVGGPVGLFHLLQQQRYERRIQRVQVCLERERQLHLANLRLLSQEMAEAVDAQQRAAVSAAQFWRALT